MSSKFFLSALFALVISLSDLAAAPANPLTALPEYQVVVSTKKIWVIADEIPAKRVDVQIMNQDGKVVLAKSLNSKTADWSVDIQELTTGVYRVFLNAKEYTSFKREVPGV